MRSIKEMFLNKKSFTIIELITVAVIIGILAAIAAPAFRDYVKRAKKAEAITAMYLIRNAERMYFFSNQRHQPIDSWMFGYQPRVAQFRSLDLNIADFDGTYFSNRCYETAGTLWIICSPFFSTNPPSPRANEIKTYSTIIMNGINGVITTE